MPLTGKVWVDVVTQEVKADSVDCRRNYAGGRIHQFPRHRGRRRRQNRCRGIRRRVVRLHGKGLGTTGLFILATSAFGNTRKSSGGYAQATYKIDKLKIGLSYGVSELETRR